MKTEWDYTELAPHYLNRPDYAVAAVVRFCDLAELRQDAIVCDVGAGSAHLTKLLVARGCNVTAVEPNDAMRAMGMSVTANKPVQWHVGTGEAFAPSRGGRLHQELH
jgi:16S rRNA A1518/A1519 N6-dimethyltransferase RsmA/KsgA/DIM1 with predicted DNA glycosylase/AP lyase activity